MTTIVKLSTGLLIAFVISTGPALVSAKGKYFDCQEKESRIAGLCKNLGRGMCSFTTGDGMTVKMRCKYIRR